VTAINKKFLIIIAALFGLILGGELLLPLIEELADLAFEWAHKTLDLLFSEVFGLAEEASQKASAWSLLLLIVALFAWAGYILRQKYLDAKAALPCWWAERKAEVKTWWNALPWTHKLAHVAGCVVLLGILAMFI
jgi:diacylglycerol kinase